MPGYDTLSLLYDIGLSLATGAPDLLATSIGRRYLFSAALETLTRSGHELPSQRRTLDTLRRSGIGVGNTRGREIHRQYRGLGRELAYQRNLPADSTVPDTIMPKGVQGQRTRYRYSFFTREFDPEWEQFVQRTIFIDSDASLTIQQAKEAAQMKASQKETSPAFLNRRNIRVTDLSGVYLEPNQ